MRTPERISIAQYREMIGKGEVKKPSKYRSQKTYIDGEKFDSKLEAERWAQLKQLESAGEIHGLLRQVKFPIVINDKRICTYIADYVYVDADNILVIEDAKGIKTPAYNLKKKMLEAVEGFEIKEYTRQGTRTSRIPKGRE